MIKKDKKVQDQNTTKITEAKPITDYKDLIDQVEAEYQVA